MKHVMKKIVALLLLIAVCVTSVGIQPPNKVSAATKYISRADFLKLVMKEIGVLVEENTTKAYVEKAKEIGLLTASSFSINSFKITKEDAAVILVRADEFLYGQTVSDKLLKEILEKRMSDINKATKAKRVYLAKAYALGYIVGKSNGDYSTDRTFTPRGKLPITDAKKIISCLNNKNARHVVAPDGQLTRTTKLPEFAKFYPYILASFPNKYYDWELKFMRMVYDNGTFCYGTKEYMKKEYKEFVSPKDFKLYEEGKTVMEKSYYSREKITAEEFYDLYAQEFEDNAKAYLNLVFNVNYKKMTDKNFAKWKEQVLRTTYQAGMSDSSNNIRLDMYLPEMKENKTIIECGKVAVDKSTIYVSDNWIYIRAYVKYRVVSSKITNERVGLSPLAYTYFDSPYYLGLKVGKWKESYFDIEVKLGPETNGVYSAEIHDWFPVNSFPDLK